MRRSFATVVLACTAALAALTAGGASASTPGTEPAGTATATAVTATEGTGDSAAPAGDWEQVEAPASCMCSDATPFHYYIRRADPTKVLLYYEGGGACFSAETCAPSSNSFYRNLSTHKVSTDGIFDFANPLNPFADYSVVFVPYCTGDVHIGNINKDYGNGVTIRHNGFINGTTAMNKMVDEFPDATKVVVAGTSAGSIPSPLYAGLVSDLLPDAKITVLADGSGGYPDVPAVNSTIGANWGTMNAVPAWPENAGQTSDTWSLPGLFIQAFKHDPNITFARHDYAFDETQVGFTALAGLPADDLDKLIDGNEQQIEAAGVNLLSYISPGDSHTVIASPNFYVEEVNGVKLVDWVSALIGDTPPADNHCTECGLDVTGG